MGDKYQGCPSGINIRSLIVQHIQKQFFAAQHRLFKYTTMLSYCRSDIHEIEQILLDECLRQWEGFN